MEKSEYHPRIIDKQGGEIFFYLEQSVLKEQNGAKRHGLLLFMARAKRYKADQISQKGQFILPSSATSNHKRIYKWCFNTS